MEKHSEKKLKDKTVVFSNDPGGAQVLSSYFYFNKLKIIYLCCSKKAEIFFKEKKIRYKKIGFKKAIENGTIFYTSTSWKSKLEIKAIEKLKQNNRKIITFIDGWDNYKSRFKYNNKYFYPDEIWNFDRLANKFCKKIFPKKIKIKLKRNYFMNYAIKTIKSYKINSNYKKNCLFITEPLTATFKKLYNKKPPYSELDSFYFFLKNIKKIKEIKNVNVKIHPNDEIKNYKKISDKFNNLRIRFVRKNIFHLLRKNFYVASCSSSLMYVAWKNKNNVICTIPIKNLTPKLPIKNIQYLYNL